MYFIFDIYNMLKEKIKSKLFPAEPLPERLREWPFPVGQVPAVQPKRGRPRKEKSAIKKPTAIKPRKGDARGK
jgi:hypothetical protein